MRAQARARALRLAGEESGVLVRSATGACAEACACAAQRPKTCSCILLQRTMRTTVSCSTRSLAAPMRSPTPPPPPPGCADTGGCCRGKLAAWRGSFCGVERKRLWLEWEALACVELRPARARQG